MGRNQFKIQNSKFKIVRVASRREEKNWGDVALAFYSVGDEGDKGDKGGITHTSASLRDATLRVACFPVEVRSVQVPHAQYPITYYSVLSGKIPLICSRFNTVAKSASLINPRSKTIWRRDLPVSKDSLATAAAFK